jgi:hypothetical protein
MIGFHWVPLDSLFEAVWHSDHGKTAPEETLYGNLMFLQSIGNCRNGAAATAADVHRQDNNALI